MQKKFVLLLFMTILAATVVSAAKERLAGGSAAFHQPHILDILEKPFATAGNGYKTRVGVLSLFPTAQDARIRRVDESRVSLVRTLLEQTVDKTWYTPPDFKTLSCKGSRIFDKDRSVMKPLAELACLNDVQVPLLRTTGLRSTNYVTSRVVNRMTGKATTIVKNAGSNKMTGRVATTVDVVPGECNPQLKDITHKTFDAILVSERDLVASELDISTCSGLPRARLSFARGNTHAKAHRYASAITLYEDAWRTAVACMCSTLG